MIKNIPAKIPFPPNKKLGQNFIFDKNYLEKIVEYCPINTNTVIIEIGSGYGNLTNLLAKTNCQKVIGIEKDQKLFQWLEESNKNNKIIYFHKDALRVNWQEFYLQYKNNSLIIVGNLPYYITNSLIINLLFHYRLFNHFIFLVQKEVGQKWVATPLKYSSKYSALSVFINYLAEVRITLEVPQQAFTPSPSVDGVLVVIKPSTNTDITGEQLVSFLSFLKKCFCFRRKTLLNNLFGFAGNWKREWESYFHKKSYSAKVRPQNLNPGEYWELFFYWQQISKNK